jgi:hypothetical protein
MIDKTGNEYKDFSLEIPTIIGKLQLMFLERVFLDASNNAEGGGNPGNEYFTGAWSILGDIVGDLKIINEAFYPGND